MNKNVRGCLKIDEILEIDGCFYPNLYAMDYPITSKDY